MAERTAGASMGFRVEPKLILRIFGDDVDYAVFGVGTPGDTSGASDDLDAFNVLQLEGPAVP